MMREDMKQEIKRATMGMDVGKETNKKGEECQAVNEKCLKLLV